jgi:hypothetical protein
MLLIYAYGLFFVTVIKSQFLLVSTDDKTIKREDFIKVMKGCKQNPAQKDIESMAKELTLDTKTTLTYDETYLLAKRLWVQSTKKLTQEEKDCNFNFN